MVAGGVQGLLVDGSGKLPGAGSAGDGHALLPCVPVRAMKDDPAVSSDMVFWLCVLAAAKYVLRLSYSKLEHRF